MSPVELARLAGAVNQLRPDWPAQSLLTFLRQHFLGRAYRDTAVALVWVAVDADSKTPARVLEPGPWWTATTTADVPRAANDCPKHPEAGLRVDQVTGNTTCAGCYADRHEDPDASVVRDRGGQPMPDDARRTIAEAIGRPQPKEQPRPDATTPTREEVR